MNIKEAENLIKSFFRNVKWKESFFSENRYHLSGDTFTSKATVEWMISFRIDGDEERDYLSYISVSVEKKALNFDYFIKAEDNCFPIIFRGDRGEDVRTALRNLSAKLQDKIIEQLDRLKKEMLSEPSYIEESRLYF